jgi:hypothetical protein
MPQMRGLAEAVIRQLSDVSNINTPQYKVTPPGLLRLLLQNPAPVKITNLAGIRAGHDRLVKLRYMKRGVPSQTTTTPGCDSGNTADYDETTVTHPLFRQISLYISNDELRPYFDDASSIVTVGSPAATMMSELLNRIIVKLNGLIGAIDGDLLTQMATRWGINASTGAATPETVNFSTVNNVNLTDGIVKLIEQAQENEIAGTLLMVGNGIANAYNIASMLQTTANQNGYDASRFTGFKWYNDLYSVSGWGANHFGVVAQGSALFIDWNRNEGDAFSGSQGNSYFFTMPVPAMLDAGQLSNLTFDVQIKELDCPTEIDGETRERGYIIYISKSFGLFTTPTDAYEADDRLTGTNGLLHYTATAV